MKKILLLIHFIVESNTILNNYIYQKKYFNDKEEKCFKNNKDNKNANNLNNINKNNFPLDIKGFNAL